MPPAICIEVALWERFGWGPEVTDKFTDARLREMMIVLEQQRVSRDAVSNLGPPDSSRLSSGTRTIESMSEANAPPQ